MKKITIALVAAAAALSLGCSEEPGPAEKAGQEIDAAVEKAGDYASEKLKEAGEAIEHAGKDMQK